MTVPYKEVKERTRRISHWIDIDLELPILYKHTASLKSGQVYLEIGTGPAGGSAMQAAMAAADGVEVWTVDDGKEWYRRHVDDVEPYDYRAIVEDWFEKHDVLGRINFEIADSVGMPWGKEVNVLFIDGDHSYEGVKADVIKWAPFVPIGGVMIFHDCTTHKSVSKAVNETVGDDWTPIEGGGSLCVFRRICNTNDSSALAGHCT
ncbi:MAG: class I SAM-dependent methyltransferase [Candidatus Hodarchaeales archaeon]|jgi:hypothetical protein